MIAMNYNSPYDNKTIATTICWLCSIALAMKLSDGSAAVAFPVLSIIALIKNKSKLILLLFLMMMVATIGNSWFFPKNMVFAVSVRGTLVALGAVMMLQNAGQKASRFVSPFCGIFFYIIWAAFPSMNGWSPIISFLKLFLFIAIFLSYYALANKCIFDKRITAGETRAILLGVSMFVIFGSIILAMIPGGIGYMNFGDFVGMKMMDVDGVSLFKGITAHSQCLGPLVSVLLIILIADLLFTLRKVSRLYALLITCSLVLLVKTSSRTALGSAIGGFMMLAWLFISKKDYVSRWKIKASGHIIMLTILVLVSFAFVPALRERAIAFALKTNVVDSQSTLSFDEVTSTRQGLVDISVNNFKKKPMLGNGFQVDQDMQGAPLNSIAEYLSAPIEKGVWIFALLEEGGVIGFFLFSVFLIISFSLLIKRHAYITATAFFTVMLTNMGEFTLFSISYLGGILWALVFCASILDAQREEMEFYPYS